MQELSGKVAIVTGGARGLGAASGRALAQKGAKVVLADLKLETAEAQAAALRAEGLDAVGIALNVVDRGSCEKVAIAIAKEYGSIDILVNNAGIVAFGRLGDPGSYEEWDRSVDVNLTGVFNMTTACLSDLKASRGAVVNIASVAAFTSGFAQVGYTASKGGVKALTQVMCRELAPFGMRVNGVAPGYVATEGMGGKGNPEIEAWIQFHCPMKRHGRPEEVGNVVAFLCTDAASFVNGTTIPVDGGYLSV
ncbi:SDR family NAD(P)-dependent oxidoreductase [Rhizobium sp. CF142]|uniref:SDR family NAD(P)-dependent oxidoreductase n=1 Tax=Rhizobium sp. CF142 TaxID=1144314 RepID=UPI00026EEC1C|nr:SDR family NAD(P)-dependent oxidoreductase [Rhizobium sp. CF142]EJJ26695.1 dehydrogenase of unknown specificity, short-chain alcohol dehydrogenase like protein [Rhizobium sp. CF142]